MSTHDEPRNVKNRRGEDPDYDYLWDSPEERIRFVDLQRIEDNRYGEPLSPFEIEVKKKLGSAASPYDELARKEEDEEKELEERSLRSKLAHLVQTAELSLQERECYELLYVERLAAEEVLRRLGISHSHLCHLKKRIEETLVKTYRKSMKRSVPRKKRGKRDFTERQREVMRMHFKEKLSLGEIANRLGIKKQTVDGILRRVQKKVL